MMKTTLTLLLFLSLATSALGVCDGVENAVGIYFDEGTYAQICAEPASSSLISFYVVLRHCTLPDLRGYEFAWRFAPPPAVTPIVTSVALLCPMDFPDEFTVQTGCPNPVPVTDLMVLARFDLFVIQGFSGGEGSYLQLGPAPNSSLPGHPVIAGGEPLQLVPMNFCSDWADGDVTVDPDGWSNPGLALLTAPDTCSAVPAAAATWSTLKALYR